VNWLDAIASREVLRRSCFTIRDITPAFFDRLVSEYQVEMGAWVDDFR
jgi:hypothetical protein